MSPADLIKLVRTLSSSEKRYFTLHTKTQAGSKEYLALLTCIEQSKTSDISSLKQEFKKRFPNSSWDNNCTYLSKMLINSLVNAKTEKDSFFQSLHWIMGIRILQERSLQEEAFKQLKKTQKLAAQSQQHLVEYLSYRYELNYFSENNFSGMTDEMLVKTQMKAKSVLKSINHIQDHYSLFELLKFRIIHSGKIISEEDKKRLNDLMLSEMVIVADKSKNSFSSRKLHLLFQSFFFTDIGDYHSALKSFHELNDLFEKNKEFLDHPPGDYLSALTGIFDSLIMVNNDKEIYLYHEKLKRLDHPPYPEYFRYQVRKTAAAQQLLLLIRSDSLEEAVQFVKSLDKDLLRAYGLVNEEKQCELYFYCSLVYFKSRDFRKAHLFLREIMTQENLLPQLHISKAIRLLNIIIYYEQGDLSHLEYEIRSYKRFFQPQSNFLKTEKLIFKIIKSSTATKRLLLLRSEQTKLHAEAIRLSSNQYEKQLLKYFDFSSWVIRIIEKNFSGDFSNDSKA